MTDIRIDVIAATEDAVRQIKNVSVSINDLDKKAGEASSGIKKASDAIDKTGEESKGAKKPLGDVTKIFGEIGLASIGIKRTAEALKKVYSTAREGAELEYTIDKFDRLSESIGTTAEKLMGDLKTATRGMYSDSEIMAKATDLVALGLANTNDEVVRLSSVAAALNMDMNELVLTLTNQTTRRFDQLGVSVTGFDEKVKHLEETGMSTNEAFTEAFLQQAEAQIARVGSASDSAIGKFMKLESSINNIKDSAKRLSTSALLPLIEDLSGFAGALDSLTSKIMGVEDTGLADYFWDINAALNPVYFWLQNLDVLAAGIGNKSLPDMIDEILRGNNALSWMADGVENTFNGWKQLINILSGKGIQAIEDTDEATDGLVVSLTNAQIEAVKFSTDPRYENPSLAKGIYEIGRAAEDANVVMNEYNRNLLFQIASQGLDAEQAVALAKAMGLVDETMSYAASEADFLKERFLSGAITAEQYNEAVSNLADNLDRVESKEATVTVNVRGNNLALLASIAALKDKNITVGVTTRVGGTSVNLNPNAQTQALGGLYQTATPTLFEMSEMNQPETTLVVPQGKTLYDVAPASKVNDLLGRQGQQVAQGGGDTYNFNVATVEEAIRTYDQIKVLT